MKFSFACNSLERLQELTSTDLKDLMSEISENIENNDVGWGEGFKGSFKFKSTCEHIITYALLSKDSLYSMAFDLKVSFDINGLNAHVYGKRDLKDRSLIHCSIELVEKTDEFHVTTSSFRDGRVEQLWSTPKGGTPHKEDGPAYILWDKKGNIKDSSFWLDGEEVTLMDYAEKFPEDIRKKLICEWL